MSKHEGGCHCGAVRFAAEIDAPQEGLGRCNCSLCRKKGIIMKPLPQEAFTLTAGADKLSLYQWNKNIAEHYFCSVCGVYTHHRRRRDPTQIAVNYECLDDVPMVADDAIGTINGQELD